MRSSASKESKNLHPLSEYSQQPTASVIDTMTPKSSYQLKYYSGTIFCF